MTDQIDTAKISDALVKVKDLQHEHFAAERARRAASSNETAILNRLNEAQKELDALLTAFRANAPCDSEWKRKEREKQFVRA